MVEVVVRPVRCFFCNAPMFYHGDQRHTPEVWVEVTAENSSESPSESGLVSDFYAHIACWDSLLAKVVEGKVVGND